MRCLGVYKVYKKQGILLMYPGSFWGTHDLQISNPASGVESEGIRDDIHGQSPALVYFTDSLIIQIVRRYLYLPSTQESFSSRDKSQTWPQQKNHRERNDCW